MTFRWFTKYTYYSIMILINLNMYFPNKKKSNLLVHISNFGIKRNTNLMSGFFEK